MKKRIILMVMIALFLCLLTACSCSHEWAEANCLSPKTCSLCGETEGEPLGHSWKEATCAAPKTCSSCGKTEGNPLPHTWQEANYQAPKTCSVCSATEGEPLIAYFDEHGILPRYVEVGESYSFVACVADDPSIKTTVSLSIQSCKTFHSDEAHEAIDGYEWRLIGFISNPNDDNAKKHSYHYFSLRDDYYQAVNQTDDTDEDGTFSVNYNGVEYVDCKYSVENTRLGDLALETKMYFRLPINYDGLILEFIDPALYSESGDFYITDIIDSNPLILRLS